MARPFIEFIHSFNLPWVATTGVAGRGGTEQKLLSEDTETGASTRLLRYPAGWADQGQTLACDEEVFVLRGSLTIDGGELSAHHYGFIPAGYERRAVQVGSKGAEVISCFSADPIDSPPASNGADKPEFLHVDPFRLSWDQTAMDPNIAHLNAYRKNLRLAPDGQCRTYLLAGLPQGFPASGTEPLERHPHVEEMFMISGDMPCSLGVMRAGAYFWRPPEIWHGADCTLNGFLLFCRTPGTNVTVSEWSDDPHPVRFDPAHAPIVPEHLAPFAAKPAPDPVEY